MSNNIQGLPTSAIQDLIGSNAAKPAEQAGGFTQMLKDAVSQVNKLEDDAQGKVAEVLKGNGGDLHSAMIAVEKAGLSFQLMVQVRNKIVAAYQEISRMNF